MSKIQTIHNLKEFEESHKSFHFLNPEIYGCDLDYCYEKRGNILILEGKQIYNDIFYLKFGQWHLLKQLQELNDKKVFVFYIIRSGDKYYMFNVMDDVFIGNANYIGQGFFRRKGVGYSKIINLQAQKSFTKEEIKTKILNITNTFTKI